MGGGCLLCTQFYFEIFADSGGHRDNLFGSIRISVCRFPVLSLSLDCAEGEL